jgi:hypothetical protein
VWQLKAHEQSPLLSTRCDTQRFFIDDLTDYFPTFSKFHQNPPAIFFTENLSISKTDGTIGHLKMMSYCNHL